MQTITIKQPWAHLIVHGMILPDGRHVRKHVENRSWRAARRGPLAIHAAARHDAKAMRRFEADLWRPGRLVKGAVIGVVELVDVYDDRRELFDALPRNCVERHLPDITPGPRYWLLRGAHAIADPIPCKGMLKFFDTDLSHEAMPLRFQNDTSVSA